MKTIIAATDYSPAAQNALHYAAQLAVHTGWNLVLFNSFFMPVQTLEAMMALPDIQERIAESKENLRKMAAELSQTYGIPVDQKWSLPPLFDELEELCSNYPDPLVVTGMRGNSLERKIFGSVTTSLISNGRFPVLVIPAKAQYRDIAKIIFACDYHRLTVDQQLQPLKELAAHYRSRLQILHVEPVPAFAIEDPVPELKKGPKLESIFRGIKHTYREVGQDDIIKGIEQGVKEYHADLLVMVPHKPNFWDYIFSMSNTRKMALRSHIPLLAIPNPKV